MERRKPLLTEHLRTCLGHNRPQPVSTITAFWDFSLVLITAGNTAGPWFKLSVFGELGLNNAGRRVAREDCKVLCQPFHPLPNLNTPLQVEAKAARAVRQAHKKAAKKQARTENDLPASNFASILSPACVTTQPWTPRSLDAAQRGLHDSPAPS